MITPFMGYFNSWLNSKSGVIFTPYMGCFYSFWSYLNSESGVEMLGTG